MVGGFLLVAALPEEIAVDLGELLDAGAVGERPKARQVDAVRPDGVRAAAAIEGLPVEVLLDGLGERSERGGPRPCAGHDTADNHHFTQ
jgi:hypothetical protein